MFWGNRWTFSNCFGHSWEQLPSKSLFSLRVISHVSTHFSIHYSAWGSQATWYILLVRNLRLLEVKWQYNMTPTPPPKSWLINQGSTSILVLFLLYLAAAFGLNYNHKDKSKADNCHLEFIMNCMVCTFLCIFYHIIRTWMTLFQSTQHLVDV